MPKVVYNSAQGLVQQAGSGIELNTTSLSFSALPFTPVQAQTATFTVSAPGVYTLTAGAIMTGTMPLASAFPGGVFVFRNGDAFANVVTGSAETAGTKVFKAPVTGSGIQDQGSKLALSNIIGASVSLISDGKSYCVLAQSGSLTFSGT
jgi:hypothetical protein